MAHSLECRRQVMAAVDEGRGTQAEVAAMFGVSDRWIRRLVVNVGWKVVLPQS